MVDKKCVFCKKSGVKLWHNIQSEDTLICAKCAEIRQSKRMANEYIWFNNGHLGVFTGNKIPLENWKVNEDGEIPGNSGIDPYGKPFSMTTTLLVNIDGISVPFIPTNVEDWKKLPTH